MPATTLAPSRQRIPRGASGLRGKALVATRFAFLSVTRIQKANGQPSALSALRPVIVGRLQLLPPQKAGAWRLLGTPTTKAITMFGYANSPTKNPAKLNRSPTHRNTKRAQP